MDYSFFDFLRLIGSLALFLYGMKIMSEGLQKFAGDSLRRIKQCTRNRNPRIDSSPNRIRIVSSIIHSGNGIMRNWSDWNEKNKANGKGVSVKWQPEPRSIGK